MMPSPPIDHSYDFAIPAGSPPAANKLASVPWIGP